MRFAMKFAMKVREQERVFLGSNVRTVQDDFQRVKFGI